MKRVPRKIKKQIPVGVYCYTPTSEFKMLKNREFGYTIKLCPFFSYVTRKNVLNHLKYAQEILDECIDETEKQEYLNDLIGFCKYKHGEVDDQCKICSLKYGKFN